MEVGATVSKNGRALPAGQFAAFQVNSLLVGLLARAWFRADGRKADDAFVAGMLRDVGYFVLRSQGRDQEVPPEGHALVSAYLLGLWGIPHTVLEPVAFHEQPERLEHDTLELVDVLHLVDRIASELQPSPFQFQSSPLDTERFARLGVTAERIEQLRQEARSLLSEVKALLAS